MSSTNSSDSTNSTASTRKQPTASAPPFGLALGAVLLGGFCLRAVGLDNQSFWIDEIASLQLAEDRLSEGLRRIRGDVHPPGYFALLHLWIQAVGRSESAVRLLSVVPSLLTVAALFRLGKLLYGKRVGLVAALIAAGSLGQIYYAQEARSYAWLMLFATLSTHATARIATRSRAITLADYAAYAAATTALLYTHYFGLFVVAAQNIFAVFLWWGTRGSGKSGSGQHEFAGGPWLLAQAAVALAWAPWLPSFAAQIRDVQAGFWIGESSLAGLGTAFLRFASLAGPWTQGGPPGYFSWLSVVVAVAVVTVAIAGSAFAVAQLRRKAQPAPDESAAAESGKSVEPSESSESATSHSAALLLGLWLLLPPLLGWSLSLVGLDVFSYRNTMVSAPAFALWLAVLCNKPSRPLWKGLAVSAVLAPSLAQLPGYYSEPHKDQWREAAHHVESHYRDDTDGIAFDAPFVRGSFFHYAPKLRDTLDSEKGLDVLAASPPDHSRIWLIRAYAGPRSRSPERIAAWGYRELDAQEYLRIEVMLFERTEQTGATPGNEATGKGAPRTF